MAPVRGGSHRRVGVWEQGVGQNEGGHHLSGGCLAVGDSKMPKLVTALYPRWPEGRNHNEVVPSG
jgi:hypothetical protein